MGMRSHVLAVAAVAALAAPAPAADVAKGALTVSGQKLTLSHVYAYARPGVFDKSKTDVVVLLADASIPQDAAHDNFALREKLPQFLSFTLDADGQIITLRPQPRPSRP